MSTMTTRLNEKNQTIDQLKEELDSCNRINKNLEDIIELKDNSINKFEYILKKNNINIPIEILENVRNLSF